MRTKGDTNTKKKSLISADANIILALMRTQPQTRDELQKAIQTSRNTPFLRLPKLIEAKAIQKLGDGSYALMNYHPLEGEMRKVMKKLQEWQWLEVPINYLAGEIGRYPDEEFKKLAWQLVNEYGLKIGNEIKRPEPEPTNPIMNLPPGVSLQKEKKESS